MAWQINASQVFFIAIIIFAIIGFMRGWRREVISLAFTLTAVLFLYLNAGLYLARFLFVSLPRIIMFVITQRVPPRPPDPSSQLVLITTVVTFIAFIALGYMIGNRAYPRPKAPSERVLGVIPAIITGFAIILAPVFFGGSLFTLAVQPLQLNSLGEYMLVIFVVAVVAIVIGLISASAKKSSGGGGGGGHK